jgi:ABC-type dipeptide/oligopeptide/nickel transport system ATPase component
LYAADRTDPGATSGKVLLFKPDNGGTEEVMLSDLDPDGQRIRSIRGKDITMIFQEPMTSFSPLYTMGNQLMEAVLSHYKTLVSRPTKWHTKFSSEIHVIPTYWVFFLTRRNAIFLQVTQDTVHNIRACGLDLAFDMD